MHDEANLQKDSLSWYAVHCKPQKESFTERILRERLDVTTYLPMIIRNVRGATREIPFFPGYIFVRIDLNEVGPISINQTPGVLRMLSFGGQPLRAPRVVIDGIKERLDALNAHGGLLPLTFRPGDAVVLKSGPFRGVEAIFVGPLTPSARVKVLIELLGRVNEVKVDVEDVAQAPNAQLDVRQRRTRGGGRRIRNVHDI